MPVDRVLLARVLQSGRRFPPGFPHRRALTIAYRAGHAAVGDVPQGRDLRAALRYAPLTLTTLAALVPDELEAEIQLIDQGVEPLDVDILEADIVGLTCITANAPLVYDLSARLRARGITTVIGGVHPTLVPDDAQPHADAILCGYAEESWPRLLRDFAAGRLQRRYDEAPDYRFENVPEAAPRPPQAQGVHHDQHRPGGARLPYRCNFCVVPVAPRYLHRPIPEVIGEIERLDGDFLFLDLSPIQDPSTARPSTGR